jgi:poly-gamma-glutamate synthesis protein (capsule biosynthesis protein)
VNSLFLNVEALFSGNDAVIGNLEGTLTTNQSISEKDQSILRFTFNPAFAGLLKELHFTAVSLANNHSLDFGEDGYEQTKQNLHNAGILSFGSATNSDVHRAEIRAQKETICLIGYHDLFTSDPLPALEEIKNSRESCSHIVLFAHWGVEYEPLASERQKMLAHQFIDAGADLVIGAHPHVVEPLEIYKNKAIFYSLGNFMFDQNFSFETEHGLTVRVEWGGEETHFVLVPVSIQHEEVRIAEYSDRQVVLSALVDEYVPRDVAVSILEKQSFILSK